MIQRCENPKHGHWSKYGGRGITVCERWRKSFEAFLSDMGSRPIGCSLDRIDNDRGYEPGNTRWATANQQTNNQRNNRILQFRGRRMTMAQWARKIGLKKETLYERLKAGWSIERALAQPLHRISSQATTA